MRFFRSHSSAKGTTKRQQRDLGKATEPFEVTEILTEPPEQRDETNVEAEMKDLFRAALAAKTTETEGDRRLLKRDISLLKKLMKRKGHLHALDDLSSKVRQPLHRDPTVAPTAPAEGGSEIRQVLTQELASDRGYDSDAHYISTPRVSDQIHECFHVHGKGRMEDVHEQVSHAAASSESDDLFKSTQDVGSIGGSQDKSSVASQQSFALLVPKRRSAKISSPLQTYRRSLCPIDALKEHSGREKDIDNALFRKPTSHSKFTEMFEPGKSGKPVLARDPNTDEVRKVSVGWMSDGRRLGYGYSFVHNRDTANILPDTEVNLCNHGSTRSTDDDRDQSLMQNERVDAAEDLDTGRGLEQQDDLEGQREPIDVYQSTHHNREKYTWSRFPSHTRLERNVSATFEDDVIVRDFCIKASPDLPMESDMEEKKRHLIPDIIHRGFFNVLLWVIGLGRREIPRYHAGMQVDAARAYTPESPELEINMPHWSQAPREGLGNHYIETWRATNRKAQRRRALPEEPQMRDPQAELKTQTVSAATEADSALLAIREMNEDIELSTFPV